MYKFKGEYIEKEAMGEHKAFFSLNLPKPHLAQGTFKDAVLQQSCYHNLTVQLT